MYPYKKFRVKIKQLVRTTLFDNFMTFCVLINTIILAMDKYGQDPNISKILMTCNEIFTYIFIIEMALKLIGVGTIKYLRDRLNYLDGTVVILSIVEISFVNNSNAVSAFRTIKIFRTFRVLRVARLLRAMNSMQVIINVLMKSLSSFIYLAFLLLLFIFIYSLLGMQTFGGKFNFQD